MQFLLQNISYSYPFLPLIRIGMQQAMSRKYYILVLNGCFSAVFFGLCYFLPIFDKKIT